MSSTSVQDYKIASLAAGFTIGFGILTVWTATQQTMTMRSPLRSVYMYMVWGEILANFIIGIIAWLFLDGNIGGTIPVYFFILFFYVFEVQLLMQIIINRIAVVAEDRRLVEKVKWGTAIVITSVNIAVFVIWIPGHLGVQPFVEINKYWDRTSKVIILLVDAGLNWWFLRIVKDRLVKHHGLTKYAPLVTFNGRLLILSIAMDAMLIGLMSLRNQVVYIQFHPVAYMVKLNIEMSMAGLITKLARGSVEARDELDAHSSSQQHSRHLKTQTYGTGTIRDAKDELHLTDLSRRMGNNHQTSATAAPYSKKDRAGLPSKGIHTTKDVHIMVEEDSSISDASLAEEGVFGAQNSYSSQQHARSQSELDSNRRPSSSKDDDDVPLKKSSDGYEAHVH